MTEKLSEYHQQVAQEKRRSILAAATGLFLEAGYDRTSLAKIADAAGVSRATLFKQFPTKAELFDAMVGEFWQIDDAGMLEPPTGDLASGLRALGTRYVQILTRPDMVSLFRIVIAEAPRFPELGRTQFTLGKEPFFDSVRSYLEAERDAGVASIADTTTAATQFLAMIADFAFWPRMLLIDWSPTEEAVAAAVDEAVATMLARYAAPVG
ncbi:TetR/AcrR family transcriptional regulator [Aeromicrobium sp. UC242_57]|uniref:TetR/AcrR family transcriptional regulator n=1 Tax=Aeromicrobium sp. UC242_57 TaxID=3374624 RepID=UPI0037A860E6